MDKKSLREFYKNIRKNTSAEKRKKDDLKITENFLSLDEYRRCKNLLAYVSTEIEVSTEDIITNSFQVKNVFCPRCVKGTSTMFFYRVENFSQLEKGAYGISEPVEECEKYTDSYADSVCIVPALSYDKSGYRLGFGKGYYDRFLEDFKGIKIGICYESCLSDKLPADRYDINVNILVTEKNVYRFSVAGKDENNG